MSVLPIHDFYRFYQIQILSAVNKARQNRAFGKRNLERCDCAAPKRNGVERWDGKGGGVTPLSLSHEEIWSLLYAFRL